jgi:hypothetical protein
MTKNSSKKKKINYLELLKSQKKVIFSNYKNNFNIRSKKTTKVMNDIILQIKQDYPGRRINENIFNQIMIDGLDNLKSPEILAEEKKEIKVQIAAKKLVYDEKLQLELSVKRDIIQQVNNLLKEVNIII